LHEDDVADAQNPFEVGGRRKEGGRGGRREEEEGGWKGMERDGGEGGRRERNPECKFRSSFRRKHRSWLVAEDVADAQNPFEVGGGWRMEEGRGRGEEGGGRREEGGGRRRGRRESKFRSSFRRKHQRLFA
jgi:hypothetical protein